MPISWMEQLELDETHTTSRETALAKEQPYIVAGIKNYFGGTGELGVELGTFRTVEFALHAREAILKLAIKKGWSGRRGIFQNGKLIKEI